MAPSKLTPEDKIRRARTGYEAAGRGDIKGLADGFADDIVWHSFGGEIRGKQKVLEFMTGSVPGGKSSRLEIQDVLAGDEHVAVIFGPNIQESRLIHLARVNADGKISEGWTSDVPNH